MIDQQAASRFAMAANSRTAAVPAIFTRCLIVAGLMAGSFAVAPPEKLAWGQDSADAKSKLALVRATLVERTDDFIRYECIVRNLASEPVQIVANDLQGRRSSILAIQQYWSDDDQWSRPDPPAGGYSVLAAPSLAAGQEFAWTHRVARHERQRRFLLICLGNGTALNESNRHQHLAAIDLEGGVQQADSSATGTLAGSSKLDNAAADKEAENAASSPQPRPSPDHASSVAPVRPQAETNGDGLTISQPRVSSLTSSVLRYECRIRNEGDETLVFAYEDSQGRRQSRLLLEQYWSDDTHWDRQDVLALRSMVHRQQLAPGESFVHVMMLTVRPDKRRYLLVILGSAQRHAGISQKVVVIDTEAPIERTTATSPAIQPERAAALNPDAASHPDVLRPPDSPPDDLARRGRPGPSTGAPATRPVAPPATGADRAPSTNSHGSPGVEPFDEVEEWPLLLVLVPMLLFFGLGGFAFVRANIGRPRSPATDWAARAAAILAILLFVVTPVGVAVFVGIPSIWHAWQSDAWPTADGVVVNVSVIQTRNSGRSGGQTNSGYRYSQRVRVRYEVDGQSYATERIRFGAIAASPDALSAQQIFDHYSLGSRVKVRHHPTAHDFAVLQPGVFLATWVTLVFGLLFALVFGGVGWLLGGGRVLRLLFLQPKKLAPDAGLQAKLSPRASVQDWPSRPDRNDPGSYR